MRLGRYGGAESKTLDGVCSIRVRVGQDKSENRTESTTIWLAADDNEQRSGMLPFGWVLVELSGSHLPQTHDFLRRNAEPAYARLASEQQRKSQIETQRIERERKEAEARQQAEARAAQERAEADRVASLSENARQAENLKASMGPGNKGRRQSDQPYQKTNQFIKSAVDWSAEGREALRAAAVTIFEHLGLKKEDYKKLIRDLSSTS